MIAYVLMKVPGKQVDEVLDQLKELPGIVELAAVYGETDVIVKIEVSSQAELDRLVMQRIHEIPAVESTRTFIAVSDLTWTRDTNLTN